MRSNNLQLPCVQPPISSYNFQLPQGRHRHHGGHVGHGSRGEFGGQNRTGQDRTKLMFKLEFPDKMCLAAFAILAMFLAMSPSSEMPKFSA